jgi:mannitol/fructose-specific phosphotransferase system IIA component (Ntr-type)
MKIHRLIEPDNVFLDLEADDLRGALTAVAGLMAPALGLDREEVAAELLEREALGSTSVGGGFAIPHCKIQGLDKIAIALSRLENGVDFGGSGDDTVSFLFIVLSPPDQPAAHLQVLSQIARVLKREDLRTALLAAADADEAARAICETASSEGM